jgi:hypothetical protein
MTDASQIIPHRVSAEHASALHGAIVIILDVDSRHILNMCLGSGCRGQLGWAGLCELAVR